MSASSQATGAPPGDETVYQAVYEAILMHDLPPGTKLAEDAIGEAFGVSRTVARKALMRLSHDGVVEIRRNRGASVAKPSIEEARAVFEARRILERAVVERLSPSVRLDTFSSLRALVAAEQSAFEAGDRARWIRLSGEFHLRLASLAGNPVIANFLRELISRTSLIIALYEQDGASTCGVEEHRALLDAIEAGRISDAIEEMEQHLTLCESKLALEQPPRRVDLKAIFGRSQAAAE